MNRHERLQQIKEAAEAIALTHSDPDERCTSCGKRLPECEAHGELHQETDGLWEFTDMPAGITLEVDGMYMEIGPWTLSNDQQGMSIGVKFQELTGVVVVTEPHILREFATGFLNLADRMEGK